MTPDQRALIREFVGKPAMAEAVKSVLMSVAAPQNWLSSVDIKLPDEAYGAQVKLHVKAAELLESGFAQLKQIADGNEGVQSVQNGAR